MIEMSRSFKKSGRSATMTMSTRNGQATKVKLEVELDDATPSSVSPSPTSTSIAPSLPGCQVAGDRIQPRGSFKRRAKASARAAQHRIFQALPFPGGFSDTRSLSDPPPSRHPLQLHPSPIVEGQRKILTVGKPTGCQPTFATLNLDSAPPPTPPPPPPPSSMQPPPCSYNCGEKRFFDHCLDCGKCFYLYLDHNGYNCFDDVDDDFCAVCELREDVIVKCCHSSFPNRY